MTEKELHYLLGLGFHKFSKAPNGIFVSKMQTSILKDLSYYFYNQNRVNSRDGVLLIEDKEVINFLTTNGVLTAKRYLPAMTTSMKPHFAAGYFEGHGEVTVDNEGLRISVPTGIRDVALFLADQWDCSPDDRIVLSGYKALDIAGGMIENLPAFILSDKMNMVRCALNLGHRVSPGDHFRYQKLSPKAVAPKKFRVSDSGYDVNVVELTKLYNTPFGAEVYKAKTQLAIQPLFGYTFDIAGRSSLPDSGWQFLQGVGVCDRSYTGGIQATLMKLSDAPLPSLPWRCLQIVPRNAPVHLPFNEAKTLGSSDRGERGFGSTGT